MQEGTGPASVDVQASILVLHDPHAQAIALPSVAPAAASPRAEVKPKRVAARPVLVPNATWNAMSALAGAQSLLPDLPHWTLDCAHLRGITALGSSCSSVSRALPRDDNYNTISARCHHCHGWVHLMAISLVIQVALQGGRQPQSQLQPSMQLLPLLQGQEPQAGSRLC